MASWLDEAEEDKAANSGSDWQNESEIESVDDGQLFEEDSPEVQAMKGAERKYEETKPGMLQSMAMGAMQGGLRDWGDNLASAIAPGKYDDNVERLNYKIERAKRENPKAFGAAEFAAMMALSPLTKNPWAAAGIAGAEGITRSLGRSNRIDKSSVTDAGVTGVIDAVTGGTLTKIAPKISEAAGKVTKPFADYFKGVAGRQAVKALGPHQGMMKSLRKDGLTEDVGNFALDNNIVNSWRTNKSMNDMADKVTQGFADQTKPIYEKSKNVKMTKDELIAAIRSKQNEFMNKEGGMKIAKKIKKYGDEAEESMVESYNPAGLRNYRREVSDGLNFNTKPVGQRGGQEMRKILRENEMGLIEKIDPNLRKENEALFRNIRLGNEVEKIAERGEARDAANNMFGLRTSLVGPMAGAATLAVTGDPTTAGLVTGGTAVGGEILRRYGNQWGAVTARKISNAASGKTYAPMFDAALKRGGSAVALLHQKLMNDDPQYRKAIESE